MTTTTVRPQIARRRRRLTAPLLMMGPTVAAAVLLSAAPQGVSMFGSVSPSPVTVSVDQIELVHISRDLLPLRPRQNGDETQTAEDTWGQVPGGPGPGGRMSDSTIQSECNLAGGLTCAR